MTTPRPRVWMHAPSTAAQWMACPGSVAMQRGLPDESGPAAEEGTRLHAIAAEILVHWVKTRTTPRLPVLYKEDNAAWEIVAPYVDFVVQTVRTYEDQGAKILVLVEKPMRLDDVLGAPAQGTPDVMILAEWPDDSMIVHVIDLKTGHDPVEDDTPQLVIYLLAKVAEIAGAVRLRAGATTIVQPRVRSEPVILDYSEQELEAASVAISAAATLAYGLSPDDALQHLAPGEKQCRWCRAARNVSCPAYNEYVHSTVMGEIQPIDAPQAVPVDEVNWTGTPVEFHERLLPLFMSRVKMIQHWIEYVQAKVASQLEKGEKVAGFKLVTGRAGARAWTDAGAAKSLLAAHEVPSSVYMEPPSLRTPAALEKALKPVAPDLYERMLSQFVTQAPGKPSVAPESDPRPAYAPTAVGETTNYDASNLC